MDVMLKNNFLLQNKTKILINSSKKKFSGVKRDRTANLLNANQMLYQLSYNPLISSHKTWYVGLSGVEPLTSRLSGVRSNQLSYRPDGNKL